MEYGFLSRAGKFLQEQTKRRRWTMIFLCLAAGVTLGTLGFLKLYGQAMTHKVKLLDCQYEVHEHTEDCYEENEDGEKVLVCGMADYVIHVHNDDCYDQKGNLVCPLEEHELHEHDDSCYEEEEVLICGEEETGGSSEEDAEAEDGTGEETEPAVQTADDSRDAEAESGSEAEIGSGLACEKEEHTHDDSCYADGAGCEKEEHTHDDGCYEETLVCEEEEHTHDDGCYTVGESELTCEEEEHEHDDDCYDEDGNLACEKDEHTHGDGCYSEGESELTCGKEEHEHGDGCYEKTLVCKKEEHEHDDSCAGERELICEKEEHEHDDSCYVETEAETKEKTASEPAEETKAKEAAETEEPAADGEAAEDGHTHTDDCYETQEVLTCGELELHTHDADPESETCCYTPDCFDEDGNLIEGSHPSCGLLQLEEHVHTEECFKTAELTPEEIAALNGGATLHVHTDECYDEEGNLICGHEVTHLHQLECYDEDGNLICGFGGEQKPEHEHDANCYDGEGNLICGNEDAKDHEHDANCYDEEGNLTCEYEGVKDHEHDANCYDEEGNLTCGYEGVKDHEHDANCYDILGELICGYEGVKDHVHTEECYDENGNLICGREVLEVYSQSKRFECDDYIIVARYNEDAEIPEEAELLAEQITPESDGEHYANRESEYRTLLEDETASMRALLKIGFYIEDEEGQTEVEPKTPVAVAIQFLDEDGLAEGKPITVIHFAEEGTEKLDGSNAKDNSTTFRMESFSEIAIGYGPEDEIKVNKNGTLHISNDFEFDADPFHMVFHVEGDAKSADGSPVVVTLPETEKADGEDTLSDTNGGEGTLPDAEQTEGEGTLPETEETGEALQPDADAAESDEAGADGEAGSVDGTASTDGDTPAGENVPSPQLNFHVKSLDEDTELRESLMDYLGESTDEVNRNILHMISYQMTYGDVELDLSDCIVTAEITLGTAVPVPAKEEADPENGTGNEAGAAEEDPAEDQGETGTGDDKTAENVDESGAADEEQTGDTEAANTVSDGLVTADQEQGNAENVKVTSQNTAVVNEITEDREEIQAFKDLLTDEDEETEISVMAIGVSQTGQMSKLATMAVGEEQQMDVDWNGGIMAIADESTADPVYTVQYYAYAQIWEDNNPGTGNVAAINVIDTSASGNGGDKAVLPQNGTLPKTRSMYVQSTGKSASYPNAQAFGNNPNTPLTWEIYEPLYKEGDDSLTKIYTADRYRFAKYSNLKNVNKFAAAGLNYDLYEVWVLKSGKDANSENRGDWEIYPKGTFDESQRESLLDNLKFTNRVESASDNVILIDSNTVVRLVGKSNEGSYKNDVRFFDYDITERVADNKVNTNRKGINSIGNYSSDVAPRLGFGNKNNGVTGLTEDKLNGYNVNQANSGTKIIQKCTYGLATSRLKNGYPVLNVNAPDLFDPDVTHEGKTPIPNDAGFSLDFLRNGDTYTLTAVGGSKVKDLQNFQKGGKAWASVEGERDQIWTNQFWPMDDADTFGASGHDPKFGQGATILLDNPSSSGSTLIPTDDGENHNSFFGMNFAVEFNLTDDYTGPLNYYFFGDDDMWVYLVHPDGSTDLVCDIGGVHQAAGEYVDLWDYIDKPAEGDKPILGEDDSVPETGSGTADKRGEKYYLKFFYTERGASGSTCWMQFTLPSVNAVPLKDYDGDVKNTLKMTKTIDGLPVDREFEFTITFKGADGVDKINNYEYQIVNSNDETVSSGIIATNGTFKLKNEQSIIIRNLPDGTVYTITEAKYDGYEPDIDEGKSTEGVILKGQMVEGTIDVKRDDVVAYINKSVPYNLPETGGPGPIWYMIAGAFFILLGTGLMYNKKFSERRV